MTIEPGRVAFEAYKTFTEGVTHDGRPIPDWDDLGENIRGAWRAAADGVLMMNQLKTEDLARQRREQA